MNTRMRRVVGIGVALCLGFSSVYAELGIRRVLRGKGVKAAVSLLKTKAFAILADASSDEEKKEALVSLLNEVSKTKNEVLIRKAIALVMITGDEPLLHVTTDAVKDSKIGAKIAEPVVAVTTDLIVAGEINDPKSVAPEIVKLVKEVVKNVDPVVPDPVKPKPVKPKPAPKPAPKPVPNSFGDGWFSDVGEVVDDEEHATPE